MAAITDGSVVSAPATRLRERCDQRFRQQPGRHRALSVRKLGAWVADRVGAERRLLRPNRQGQTVAANVDLRFVPDATTRVTDVVSGTSQLVRAVPYDELEMVEAAADVVEQPIAGCAFVRIPTDVAPFDDAMVRLALNHAVDVEAIIASLLGGNGVRLPNVFVPGGLGYDPDLAPHAYDPELAQQLLAKAGYPDGFSTRLAYATGERDDLVAAVAGQLGAAGIDVELEPVETATFNASWQDPESAPLRLLTWRPLFDPYTLLSLVISNTGFL